MTFRHALIVEDEVHLAQALVLALKHMGIRGAHAHNLAEARTHARDKQNIFDLVILDRMLPDGDGIDLCHELRADGWRGHILVLSASGHVGARVEGLNAGADDYLSKPFSWDELKARIAALARRNDAAPAPEKIKAWNINRDTFIVTGPTSSAQLTPLELKLFDLLSSKPGKIFDRRELLQKVWELSGDENTRSVDLFMSRLRKYFEIDPENPVYFLTVRGAGYQFNP